MVETKNKTSMMDDRKERRQLFRNIACGLIVLLIIVSFFKPVSSDADDTGTSNQEKKPRKLQIGIKKRPETCERKSKKDDLLHIHYRVTKHTPVAVKTYCYCRGTLKMAELNLTTVTNEERH